MPQVKLKRLKIQKYRNVKPGTELHFDDGINLILGQNASGKTTLLALISAVCRADFREYEDEELDLKAEIELDERRLSLTVSHEPPSQPAQRSTWRCTLEVDRWSMTLDDAPAGWSSFDLSFYDFTPSPRRAIGQAFRFDESLDTFLAATGRTNTVRGAATPPATLVEATHVREDMFLFQRSEFFPPDQHPTRSVTSPDEPLCHAIAEALGVVRVARRPEIREHGTRKGREFFRIEGSTFDITRHDGTTLQHDRLSYGQKRLLAFYYYLACNPEIVIADELVNGLHHRWIDACMKALGDRQAFLTSQNPLLFDYVDFDSVEQVQARFITCRLEQIDGREQMVWENMQRDDAEQFFAAYQAEIEHVGEILMNRGLW